MDGLVQDALERREEKSNGMHCCNTDLFLKKVKLFSDRLTLPSKLFSIKQVID